MTATLEIATILRDANLRLCRIWIWTNYNGLGFDLKASPKPPHAIRVVALYSPAATAGLLSNDLVIAVNNQDISSADYTQAVDAIKHARDGNGCIELLVVEPRFYEKMKKKNIKIDVNFANVIEAPQTMPHDFEHFFEHPPRTCIIRSNAPGASFGFNVNYNETDVGVCIQEVYPNTPASRSALYKNDRIIEINDIFIDEDSSKSIFKKLDKARAKGKIKLYVIDMENYKFYQRNNIPLSSKEYKNTPVNNKYLTINRTEDIRLCTISLADATDIFGFQLTHDSENQVQLISISTGRNNEPSSENFILRLFSSSDFFLW